MEKQMFTEKQHETADKLKAARIIPVLALENVDSGLKLIEILAESGLRAVEITYRTKAAPGIIREAVKKFPQLFIGAGTILNTEHLKEAFAIGSSFAVAPGFNPRILEEAVKQDFAFSPGIATPSELEQAHEFGVRLFKFFPAEALGGTSMLKNIIAPYKHLGLRFMPTGGVTAKNAGDWLAVPEVVSVGGTWLGKADDVANGDWEKIRKEAAGTVEQYLGS